MAMYHTVAAYMLIVIPVLSILQHIYLRKNRSNVNKKRTYQASIALMWTGAIAVTFALPAEETFRFREQVAIPGFVHVLFGITVVFLIVTFVVPIALTLTKNREFLDKVKEQYDSKSFALPVRAEERRLFPLVALSVGIGEELMFRSFLVRYLHALPFDWAWLVCFLTAAVLFALVHFQQGAGGIFNAFMIGICFSYLFVVTGSLLLPIALHILYDLKVVLISHYIYKSGDKDDGGAGAGTSANL